MSKSEFTSFDVAAVVRELRQAILDSHVNKIYQPSEKTLLFKLRKTDKPVFWLVLEAGRRLHLTSYSVEKPKTPRIFCKALRKHLRNGRLVNVQQYEFDRIVVFDFGTKAGMIQLVSELFGEGNIVLVDENGKILHALTHKRMRDRKIIRHENFHFPPSIGKDPFKVGKEKFLEELQDFGSVEVVRALARLLSIGGFYAEEILLRAGVDKTTPCGTLSDLVVSAIFEKLHDMLSEVTSHELKPYVVSDEGGRLVDVVPFQLKRYAGFQLQPHDSFNEALDEFYTKTTTLEKAARAVEVERLEREAAKLKRIIRGQERACIEAEAEAKKAKCIGDVIYSYIGELRVLLDRFLDGKKGGKEWSEVVSEILAEKKAGLRPTVFFESLDAKGQVVNVCVDGLCFALGLRKKLSSNASRFYERSKRAGRKFKGAQAALKESVKKLDGIEAQIRHAKTLERIRPVKALAELDKRKIKRKQWFEKFRWFASSDDFLVVAGKDAVSNEVLVKKYAESKDVVFHADIVGAPFVVIKADAREPSDQCLREGAEFAAAFSRGWREGYGSVDVYWVMPDQLSKRGRSGELVPRGAFVVRGPRNWMRGIPLRIAIGIARENDDMKFVGGPVDAVRAKTNVYLVIVPGNLSGKRLFKRVLGILAGKVAEKLRKRVLDASIEEIREYVPYSKGEILEK